MGLALTFNALLGNVQQKYMQEYDIGPNELVIYGSFCSAIVIIPWLVYSHELIYAFHYLQEHSDVLKQMLVSF